MRRVVITGAGIVSCIGHDLATVTTVLKEGQSGIVFNESYAEHGFKSQVSGSVDKSELDTKSIDRKLKRFFSDASLYAYVSALAAIEQAGLAIETVNNNPRVALVASSGGASTENIVNAVDAMREKGLRGVGAMAVPKTMGSSVSAALATGLKIQGVSYSLTSACATSTHCIGHAAELIQLGKADVVLAGGSESEHWTQSCMFDAMGAVSTQYNETPKKASRAYDKDRDGFVIAAGGAMLVVESLEHATARGANILAEIVGYGASSDGAEMVAPSGEGAVRCMQQALDQAGLTSVDYINSHGTSTPLGDITELKAIAKVFSQNDNKDNVPPISSTKSMTGHSLGAVGAQELIYCLLMLQDNFIAPSINVETLDAEAEGFDIVTQKRDVKLDTIMSNSFGFGGTNATLIIKRFEP
ncbi:beta-ketoacyl-ACP synthase II [Psychrobacter jeotgali]|uniref:beta-ketoacyl-ACP synthase II n=1 Tax=Psychrobacter jeotgali TaxID=179010 RepID=UPI0019193860|nr:beta-ketoacyl-ACP synthase II [Psychrobacter jeotgali]